MSEETKSNEPVKQEGEFKIKKKKPKNLSLQSKDEITKVDLTKPEATGDIAPEVIKVEIPTEALKKEEDAIQIGETKKMDVGEQTGDSSGVDEQVSKPSEVVEEITPIQEITKEEVKEIAKKLKKRKEMKKS